MTNPDKPNVGDLTARLEFRYENDPLDFLKTGKGYLVVDDKVATIPLPTGEKGEKGDTGRLAEGDVRYFNHRTDEAEAAAEAAKTSETNAKSSEAKAKTSETNAKTSETNAKSSETKAKASEAKAKTSETNAKASEEAAKSSENKAKTSETNAKASEEESASQSELSTEAAAIASLSAIAFDQLVGEGSPEGKVEAPVGSIYTDRLATNGAIRWIKTTGTGNTGWRVKYGDTGWRDVSQTHLGDGWVLRDTNDRLLVRRENGLVHVAVRIRVGEDAPFLINQRRARQVFLETLPRGFGQPHNYSFADSYRHNVVHVGLMSNGGVTNGLDASCQSMGGDWDVGDEVVGNTSWATNDPWPTTLPGTPA